MNFGKWIIVAFVLFAAYMAVLVTVCVRQDVNLVSKDYYRDELKYQAKLDKINNAMGLSRQPTLSVENGLVKLSFSENQSVQQGTLKIERPSNARLDRNFALTPGLPTQEFELGNWQHGLYRASVTWTMADKEYYMEKQIIL